MAVDPLTAKILAKVAVQAATDSESRKRILFMILAPVLGLLLLIAFILYLITSPFSVLSQWLIGDEVNVVEDFQKQYGYNQQLGIYEKDYMRNYANAKFFVVDAACIEESGNDFTLALQSFQMMFSARIIVILSGYEDVNGEVQRLLSIGVVNLVTGETMEDALDELTEALSEDGMQRYVVKAPVYEQPATQREKAPEPDEIIPYRWNARNIRIAVAGSQRRSGVTVTAFNLASWLAARGAEVAYIEVNQNRHLQLLLNIYEAAPDGEHYTIDGIDCYLTNEPDKAYQFIIYDCGVMQTPTSIFRDADHRLLCGSVLPYEIPVFHKALSECGSLEVRPVAICVPQEIQEYCMELFGENVQIAAASHDLFAKRVNGQIYRPLVEKYIAGEKRL